MKKILIAIASGPTAEKIAQVGFETAKQLNSEVALLSVVDTTALITNGGVTPRELADIERNDLRRNQNLLIGQVLKNDKIWTFIEEGKPSEIILKVAEEWGADLIVLGTHGRTGLSHLLMGSVAEKVVRHSTKPLLIIPTR